jgi:hypothetical protein
MTIELSAEDMELVLHALKEYGRGNEPEDVRRLRIDGLISRLEVIQRRHQGRGQEGGDP